MVVAYIREWFYTRRLQKYFDKHYSQYGNNINWFVTIYPYKWQFIVINLGCLVTLTCTNLGKIVEEVKYR